MVGGEEMGSWGGKDAGKVAAGRLDMQINWEEKRGSNTDCTTLFFISPLFPPRGNKTWKSLAIKTCGGCDGCRKSQSHKGVHRRNPQGPGMYANPATQELAPEQPNSLVGKVGEVTESGERAKQAALFPLWPLPHREHQNAAKWVALPWQILKASPLTT